MSGAKRVRSSPELSLIREIIALRDDEEEKPTDYAIEHAIAFIKSVGSGELIAGATAGPLNGGLEIEWNSGERYVRFLVPASDQDDDYLAESETAGRKLIHRKSFAHPTPSTLRDALDRLHQV